MLWWHDTDRVVWPPATPTTLPTLTSPPLPAADSVLRTATLSPNISTAKSSMSSADVAHRLVSPRLGRRAHSSTVDATTCLIALPGGAPNSADTAPASNGILAAMSLGRNARGGILSVMSGIGIRFPVMRSRSRKNFPGSGDHLGGGRWFPEEERERLAATLDTSILDMFWYSLNSTPSLE
uniref:Uncharacterized protein n=1 Tax=Triticum urartu TaxID=4572 RepID=A0A8R7QNK2_TRIUA